MKEFFESQPDKGPIDPCDAYFGGRTGPICLYGETGNGFSISMSDIVSLYPSVNYESSYPVRIPKIKKPNKQNVLWTSPDEVPFDGLLKVRVIVPKNLFLPVLPYHEDDMLLFPVCGICAKNAKPDFGITKNMKKCDHSDEERGLTGLFTSIELKKAIEMGAKVDKFYRAYHFENFDNSLFKSYVRKFLKIKVEASGWPTEIKTDEDKKDFIEKYKTLYDIHLDPNNMILNPGLRHIAKLALNSLWGKFSMRNKLSKNEIVTPSRFFELLTDYRVEISKTFLTNNKNMVRVIYREKDDFVKEHSSSNIIISLWTTSQARVKLYEYMELINNTPGCKILYTDTDSIIYLHPIGNDPMKYGKFLGEMTKEYSDCEILEYVSAGPKQYALKLKRNYDGAIWYKTKIRGITQNRDNKIDYDDFKNMVLQYSEKARMVFNYPDKFGPTRENLIITRGMTKEYKPVMRKGIINENLDVLPYGFW